MDTITVGGVSIGEDVAADWVSAYTDVSRHSSKAPSAYPAYDQLDTGSSADKLNGGDLLAPTLLNAAPSVSAFNRLEAIAPHLEKVLSGCPHLPLASASEGTIRSSVGALYAILDEDHETHPSHGLGGTTLSKVLHRKRPHFLGLSDQFVWSCYVEHGPIERATSRSWADYMVRLALAMRNDLTTQQEKFEALRSHCKGPALSDLRILDILAWTSKGRSEQAA